MSGVELLPEEQAMLGGAAGPGVAEAMRIVIGEADSWGTTRLLEVNRAHLTSCADQAHLDLVQRLLSSGTRVMVPTTLDLGAMDLLHPERTPDAAGEAKELMEAHIALGAKPTFTDAPFQMDSRPKPGTAVAWGRSVASLMAGMALGAHTNPLSPAVALAAAVTGRVPHGGLHLDSARTPSLLVQLAELPAARMVDPLSMSLLGRIVGRAAHGQVPLLVGLGADPTEEALAAFAAGALDGGLDTLALVAGVTPGVPGEGAAALSTARSLTVTDDDLAAESAAISTPGSGYVDAVVIGTPQAGISTLKVVADAVAQHGPVAPGVELVIGVSRSVRRFAEVAGLDATLARAGALLLQDTSVPIARPLGRLVRTVVTDSAPLGAWLRDDAGLEVVLASTNECIRSAASGRR